jgi:hypothetical protein
MRSRFNGAGYLFSDNRASDWNSLEEDDILGCSHCQATIKKSVWRKSGGYCCNCDKPLCLNCAEKMKVGGVCESFKRFIDQELARRYRIEQNARVLGI